jgi:hypothetical protein
MAEQVVVVVRNKVKPISAVKSEEISEDLKQVIREWRRRNSYIA